MGSLRAVPRRAVLGLLLALLMAAATLSPASALTPASARADGALVTVSGGTVRGKVDTGGREFLGIPYAAPPTGERRFRHPQPAAPWPGVRDATQRGTVCPQAFPLGNVSEDCLLLNVYTPPAARSRNLPVMVWIHGGAYTLGTAAGYDPAPLVATGDVIVVSMNYRLGPFGFMALPGLAGESGTTGNYALLDQQAALRWVRRNIAAFGGNPGNVTIFGESAGGHSVCMQLISPTAAGLFTKAISQSGGCVDTELGPRAAGDAYKAGQDFARSIGCPDADTMVACLRGKSVNDLLSGAGNPLGELGWTPTIDGKVLKEPTKTALRAGRYNKVPLLNGSNKDEGRLFTAVNFHLSKLRRANADDLNAEIDLRAGAAAPRVRAAYPPESPDNADLAISQVTTDGAFSCPALFTARAAAGNTGQKVFTYEFSDPNPPYAWLDPFMPLGDYHASELFYLFATLEVLPPLGMGDEQKRLSAQMVAYWTTFARTGDPNTPGNPTWPAFTTDSPQTQRLTSKGTAPFATFPADHNCHLWE